jgi:hypothetical protein
MGPIPGRTLDALTSGERRHLGCVLAAVTIAGDVAAPPESPVVRVAVQNDCRRPVPLDLGRMIVLGRYRGQPPVRLAVFDPQREIHAGVLDPGRMAREALQYDPPVDLISLGLPRRICVSLEQITPIARRTEPLCFNGTDEGYIASAPESGW